MIKFLFKTFATTLFLCGFGVSAFAATTCPSSQSGLAAREAAYQWLNQNYTNDGSFFDAWRDEATRLGISTEDSVTIRMNYTYYRQQGNAAMSGDDFSAIDSCMSNYQPNNNPPAPNPTPNNNTGNNTDNSTPILGPNGTQQTAPDFFTFVKNILEQDLQPLMSITTTISYMIGLFLIITGMTRLYRHGSGTQNMMHRASPTATAMYFVAGIVLVSFMPYLQMISNSIFPMDASSVLMHQCSSTSVLSTKQFETASNDFCPMLAYSQNIPSANSNSDAIGQAMKYLIFGVLFLVGVISFIRGMVQLVKIGEGGQGGGLGKAFTHIFAGIVAVNADSFYMTFENILATNVHS